MIKKRMKALLARRRCTLLAVGPMSLNCVNAAIDVANRYGTPLMLAASRRQIDSEDMGGGYVNNWTTRTFAEYVARADKRGKIILCRDHGGPWQNEREVERRLDAHQAMASAKASFLADIEAGFRLLHIDTSIDIHNTLSIDKALDRLFELYEFCWESARRLGRDIIFEVGTEEQSGSTVTQEELEYTLVAVMKFCRRNRIQKPAFAVIQTGTKVLEMRNVGSFDSPVRVVDELPPEIQVPQMIAVCHRYDVLMKQHNTDYLSDEALKWHPRLGIHAANVAPEFGVVETKAFVNMLRDNGLKKIADRFLDLSLASGKWKKWVLPETGTTDYERALICGHYLFATDEFRDLHGEAGRTLGYQGINLDESLKEAIRKNILRYMTLFRLVTNS